MNEQELNLTKLSYVNKDFASIYPDLLDLVKTLTNRWDPSTSNESDPGVVLLKVGAFLADHLNYNIDKNILECFLPSATQEESVRKIAEFGGYVPKYYRSAIGKVSVTYNPDVFPASGGFTIPAFSLVVSNDDGSITYTQLDPIVILSKNIPATGRFIEGVMKRLSVDSDVITLNNIDNFNRLYFPNQYIAENGVFIYNISVDKQYTSDPWERTDYIYTRPIGTRCYKIDYDSVKGLPYIEFPSDIANLIEDGLAIYYIYTAGSYGNVKAKELNTLVSIAPTAGDLNADDFIISNSASITNGCEPETIDEIYKSYKKVVGTFDTLVSTQDYSNAIRTVEDENGEPYISNGLVTDRRIDYNNALNVCTMRSTGVGYTNVALNKFGKITFKGSVTTLPDNAEGGWVCSVGNKTYLCIKTINSEFGSEGCWVEVSSLDSDTLNKYLDGMSPYDLIIYALQKYAEGDYNSLRYWQALNNSFRQIPGDTDPSTTSVNDVESSLIAALENYKCINHTFTDLKTGQVYCFKNYVPLVVDIVPYNKVTKYERNEILDNIRRAISNNFNASMVEFGEELNYDTVKSVIESADPRINYVRLADFNYRTVAMLKSSDPNNADEIDLFDDYEGATLMADIAAKNVLAGKLCLFNFDKNFNYEFGQTDCDVYTNIVKIDSKLNIPAADTDPAGYKYNYLLSNNEYLEIFYPNYYSEKTFGSYVLYAYEVSGGLEKTIPAGVEYTLSSVETIHIYYKDSNGEVKKDILGQGTVIRTSFDLKDIGHNEKQTFVKDGKTYNQLASNESISTRILLDTKLNTTTYVYWILNNTGNILFGTNDTNRILGDGEFFIYADSTKNNLTIMGRGTKLTRDHSGETMVLSTGGANSISKQQLAEEGLAAKIPFSQVDFSVNPLTITEMNIMTLGEGDSFKLTTANSTIDYATVYANNIEYTLVEDPTPIKLPAQENFYEIRTRLDINITKDSPQQVGENQVIKVIDASHTERIVDPEGKRAFIQSNTDLNLVGNTTSDGIDISVYADLGIAINWLTYTKIKMKDIEQVPSTTPVAATDINKWINRPATGEFAYTGNPVSADYINTGYVVCSPEDVAQDRDNNIIFEYNTNVPRTVYYPFSTVWYDYLVNSEAIIDREYLFQIYLNSTIEPTDKVKVSFVKLNGTTETAVDLLHYGNIGEGNTLIPNSNIYVYPKITSAVKENIWLKLEIPYMVGSYISVSEPTVSWGGNLNLGTTKNEVQNRMTTILNDASTDVQFHWTNEPSGDLALVNENLGDPYSFFDRNNVANIITIPVVDLENSYIDIVRSMRDY